MPEVRFDAVYYPGDGFYRTVDCFGDNGNLDWFNPNKDGFLAEAQKGMVYGYPKPLGWIIENLDLRREPPMRSHARGLISRFNMDKLDGIAVRKVLENNPGFYSLGYEKKNVLVQGETILTDTAGEVRGNTPVLCEDDTNTETFIAEKPKASLKSQLKRFFRRLSCLPLTSEE